MRKEWLSSCEPASDLPAARDQVNKISISTATQADPDSDEQGPRRWQRPPAGAFLLKTARPPATPGSSPAHQSQSWGRNKLPPPPRTPRRQRGMPGTPQGMQPKGPGRGSTTGHAVRLHSQNRHPGSKGRWPRRTHAVPETQETHPPAAPGPPSLDPASDKLGDMEGRPRGNWECEHEPSS